MQVGQLKDAERRALNLLDAWLGVTRVAIKGTSYYYELQGIIEDAVKCGAQAARGVYEKLDSEM